MIKYQALQNVYKTKVNKNLGKNNTKDRSVIDIEIKKRIGDTKVCEFGHKRGSATGIKHEGLKDVPIESFELKDAYVIGGQVIINGDGLHGFL